MSGVPHEAGAVPGLRAWLTADVTTSAGQASAQRFYLGWRRLRSNSLAVGALLVLLGIVLVAVLAPWIAPEGFDAQDLNRRLLPPSAAHPFGTDDLGRDLLARLAHGARITLMIATLVAVIVGPVGLLVGTVAGYFGGWVDAVIGRLVDAMLACPFLILGIALAAFLGPALTNAMIAIGVTAAPVFVRVARGATMDAAANEYVEAAKAIGNPPWRVAVRHILPNIVPPLMVQATLAIAAAVIGARKLIIRRRLALPVWPRRGRAAPRNVLP